MSKTLPAMDVNKIKQIAVDEAMDRMQSIQKACLKVRPIVGLLDPFSFKSEDQVYKVALDHKKIDTKSFQPEAFAGMVEVALASDTAAKKDWDVKNIALDSIPDEIKKLAKVKG